MIRYQQISSNYFFLQPNILFFTESSAKAAERTETINIVRTLIDYNKVPCHQDNVIIMMMIKN